MSTFDERAAAWDQNPMRIERAAAVARAICVRIPVAPAWQALEYGCGTGLLSFALQDLCPLGQITLADNSRGMLAVLDEKIRAAGIENMQPLYLDLSQDALPAQRFDLIYTLLTLHHIQETHPILAAFHQLLKPGGRLAIADLDVEDGTFHAEEAFDGHFGFAREDLNGELLALGFSQIHFDTPYTMIKTRTGQPRSYPLFLLTACKR